jgi:hypothetical protein
MSFLVQPFHVATKLVQLCFVGFVLRRERLPSLGGLAIFLLVERGDFFLDAQESAF